MCSDIRGSLLDRLLLVLFLLVLGLGELAYLLVQVLTVEVCGLYSSGGVEQHVGREVVYLQALCDAGVPSVEVVGLSPADRVFSYGLYCEF